MSDNLKDRVEKFQALELPGQPTMMHVGTLNLVNDLWREVLRLRSLADSLGEDNDRILKKELGPL